MANINLASENLIEKKTDKEKMLNSGLVAVIVVFLLVLGIFIAEQVYKKYLSGQLEKTKSDYTAKYSELSSPKGKDVVDFKRRLEVSKKALAQGRNVPGDFPILENIIIPEVLLTSYSYDESKSIFKLSLVTNDYNFLAKQVLNFKKSDYFGSVEVDKTARDVKTSEITFGLLLTLK